MTTQLRKVSRPQVGQDVIDQGTRRPSLVGQAQHGVGG
jgi:hypothetical protein